MIQKSRQSFESADGKATIFVDNDMPIGVFHDFLMEIKGTMVDRMVAAHKEQIEQIKQNQELVEQDTCCGANQGE